MKTLRNENGFFVLPIVLMILAVLGIVLMTPNMGTNNLQTRRLLTSSNSIALKISTQGSMASALRNSAAANPILNACLTGATCTATAPNLFFLADPVWGSPQVYIGGATALNILYDAWGRPCQFSGALAANGCPLSVVTQFSILCPGGVASCPSSQASIQVSYTVQKTPGSNYPGSFAPLTTPAASPVPVNCITYVGPTTISPGAPACY